jgi:hypothetical protein
LKRLINSLDCMPEKEIRKGCYVNMKITYAT